MQHFLTPTRLTDLSEDALTALFFSLVSKKNEDKNKKSVVYVIAIKNKHIKYYDSDSVCVVSNLAKTPINNNKNHHKSKIKIIADVNKHNRGNRKKSIIKFNKTESVKFLLHDIKEDKSYFESKIDPRHITSILCVKPKISNKRLYGQKGAFLLFGLNPKDPSMSPDIISHKGRHCYINFHKETKHPIARIKKIKIGKNISLSDLNKIGITMPYIYTGIEKVAGHFTEKYSKQRN